MLELTAVQAAMGSSMRFHTLSLICSALIVLSVSVVAAQSALPLDGKWEGTLPDKRATGSRELRQAPQPPVVVAISTDGNGKYVGKWWMPSASQIPDIADIGDVTIDGDAIRIDVPSHGVWEGKLNADGLTLAGEWRQGGKTTPLVLRRTGNANEPVSASSPGTRGPIQR
jgi:hypothetical protein